MTWHSALHVFALLASVTLLAGCSPAAGLTVTPVAAATPGPSPLEGTEWLLVALNGRPPFAGSNVTLEFEDGTADGTAGCNSYGGPYTASADGALHLPELAQTLMLCTEPPGVMEQEQAFVEILHTATIYRLTGDRLEIANALSGQSLTFALKPTFVVDSAALMGSHWQLVSIDDRLPGVQPPITLVFDDETQVSGYAGCRHYRAAYHAEGDDIGFPFLEMIEADCPASGALDLEGRFTDALSTATDYRLAEGRLEILTTRQGVLVFETLEH